MKFFYAPNACSLGIHVMLEDIGEPFTPTLVDFAGNEQYQPTFIAKNPKSKVPMVERDDGSILTEFPAIALYLARSNPAAKLLPADLESEIRALELLEYMTATVHMRGFSRMNRPAAFALRNADVPAVVEVGRGIALQGMEILSAALGDKDYLLGAYSVTDAALFFLEFWSVRRHRLPIADNITAHFERMLARPAVQRALGREGLA